MSHEERVATLMNFGYSRVQAQFLVVAALGSGYFLRRQFHQHSSGGSQTELFISRLIRYGHATVHEVGRGRRLYHLSHGPMYRALGAAGSRNQRTRGLMYAKARVMGLDYIMSQTAETPLLTTQDKREHLISCGMEATVSPGRFPMLTDGHRTTFVYVDEGNRPVASFAEWLHRNSPVFGKLNAFRVVYVTTTEEISRHAASAFERVIAECRPGDYDQRTRDLLDYFSARHAFETRGSKAFGLARLSLLRDSRQRFAGAEYDELYNQWKTSGPVAIGCGSGIAFETYALRFDFGALRQRFPVVSGRRTPETPRPVVISGDGKEVSGLVEVSEEVSGAVAGRTVAD